MLKYSFEEFHKDVKIMVRDIKANFEPEVILAIARGGLTLGHFLASLLNNRNLFTLNSIHYEETQKLDTIDIFNIPDLSKFNKILIVDDMIDTAGTITEAINVLNNAGAKKVIVVATHGILSDPAAKRLSESGAAEVVVTDTLPIPAEKRFEQLTVLSIAPLLARAIQEVFEDGSVTSLFN